MEELGALCTQNPHLNTWAGEVIPHWVHLRTGTVDSSAETTTAHPFVRSHSAGERDGRGCGNVSSIAQTGSVDSGGLLWASLGMGPEEFHESSLTPGQSGHIGQLV